VSPALPESLGTKQLSLARKKKKEPTKKPTKTKKTPKQMKHKKNPKQVGLF